MLADTRLWDSLVDLAVMLRKGEADLDVLTTQVEKKKFTGRKILKNSTQDSGITKTDERKSMRKIIFKVNGEVLNPPINIHDGSVSCIKKPSSNKRSRDLVEEEESHKRSKTLSQEIKKRILDCGGREESALLVIDKKLFQTDVDPNQCRLSVPQGKVNPQFLKKLLPSEITRLDSPSGWIPVTLVGAHGDERVMSLKNWKSNSMYALVEGWKDVCRDNALKVGQAVQLWCFRRDQQLCFALV